MEDSLLLTILQDQTKVATRTEQKVDDMNKRLFGNGQPGVIQAIHTQTVQVKSDLDQAKDELGKRISRVDAEHKKDRYWLKGALAILALEVGAIGFYFKYLYGVIRSLVK